METNDLVQINSFLTLTVGFLSSTSYSEQTLLTVAQELFSLGPRGRFKRWEWLRRYLCPLSGLWRAGGLSGLCGSARARGLLGWEGLRWLTKYPVPVLILWKFNSYMIDNTKYDIIIIPLETCLIQRILSSDFLS